MCFFVPEFLITYVPSTSFIQPGVLNCLVLRGTQVLSISFCQGYLVFCIWPIRVKLNSKFMRTMNQKNPSCDPALFSLSNGTVNRTVAFTVQRIQNCMNNPFNVHTCKYKLVFTYCFLSSILSCGYNWFRTDYTRGSDVGEKSNCLAIHLPNCLM